MSQLQLDSELSNDYDNPYQLIRRLRSTLNQHRQQLSSYEFACQSYQSQNQLLKLELSQKQKILEAIERQLHNQSSLRKQTQLQLDQMRVKIKTISNYKIQLKKNMLIPSTSAMLVNSRLIKTDKLQPKQFNVSWVPQNKSMDSGAFHSQNKLGTQKNCEDFVPQKVRFKKKTADNFVASPSLLGQTFFQNGPFPLADSFVQDFLVIGPDLANFRKVRDSNKEVKEIKVSSDVAHNINRFYKTNKPDFIKQIARRAFPQGIKMRKRLVENLQDIQQIFQFKPQRKISEDYFFFTLKGQQQVRARNRGILGNSNPNNFLFIVCLKLPDFIYIRDEKHYQRKQQQVWICDKVYAFVTYYPFFDILISVLQKIENCIYTNRIRKIMVENDNFLIWQFSRNNFDIQKNQTVRQVISYFVNKKPDYGQVCFTADHYFGIMPQFGYQTNYAIARSCCGIFFSTFSYEQALLLLTAIFCQKTLVFLSKNESVATMCGLFLISVIYPFLFTSPLLLNCDSDKIKNMIFEFPFALVASVKKTPQNIGQIVGLFAESNILRFKGPKGNNDDTAQYILIDVDSNTILYDPVLIQIFEQTVFSPSEQLRSAYLSVNNCNSISFSFPKKMPREVYKSLDKYKTELQKNEQEKRKAVKQYLQMFQNNSSKMQSYSVSQKHDNVLKLFVQFINSLTIDRDAIDQFLQFPDSQARLNYARVHLLQKHKERSKFIEILIKSQIYANYMDAVSQQS